MSSKTLEFWANIFKSINKYFLSTYHLYGFAEDIRNIKHAPYIQKHHLVKELSPLNDSKINKWRGIKRSLNFLITFTHFHNSLAKAVFSPNFTWIVTGEHLSCQVTLKYGSTISYLNLLRPNESWNSNSIWGGNFWRVMPCLQPYITWYPQWDVG